jgi:hypothetical protein
MAGCHGDQAASSGGCGSSWRGWPNGTPLRVLAGIVYGAGPAALTAAQLTSARQVLGRLAGRGEAIADRVAGGVKLWRTVAAAKAESARREQERQAEHDRGRRRRAGWRGRAADWRSWAQRWRDAAAQLVTLQDDCRAWLDSLPDNLAESATAEMLRAVCELDLSELDYVEPPWFGGGDRLARR